MQLLQNVDDEHEAQFYGQSIQVPNTFCHIVAAIAIVWAGLTCVEFGIAVVSERTG
jgi:hypothetical protein